MRRLLPYIFCLLDAIVMIRDAVDLVIHSGTIVSPEVSFVGSIAVDGGIVVALGADPQMPPARKYIDATGRHVLPGVIDCHVHFRDPGTTRKEDWASGTAAAACGGVTTVFEMPSTNPPVDSLEGLSVKADLAARSAYVDYGLYALLGQHNLYALEALSEREIIGFKCFMTGSLSGDLPAPDDGAMLEGFETLARLGRRCTVHAENLDIVVRRERQLKEAGRNGALAHAASRPPVAAAEAVSRAIIFAEASGMRLHIAHESSGDALPIIAAAKARGIDVTAETCPQYLLINADELGGKGGVFRCNPPIRERGHDRALWQGLADGTIDMLATDHAPHLAEEKTHAEIWRNASGIAGVEVAVPLMLSEVNRGRLSINQYVALSASNPAKAWDLYPRKGALKVGSDADVVIVDLDREAEIDQEKLHSKSRITGWHGRRVKGLPVCTVVRGKVVMLDGRLVGEPGWGQAVRQEPRGGGLDRTGNVFPGKVQ